MEKMIVEILDIFLRKGAFAIYAAMLLVSLLWWTVGRKFGILRSLRWAVSAQSDDDQEIEPLYHR